MALNPLREALGRAGRAASQKDSPFREQADAALTRFRAVRDDLARQVRRGDLTLKAARAQAEDAATHLRVGLMKEAESFSPVPRAFLDRLVEVGAARKRAREHQSLEALQRETNQLLRHSLIEQQLQTRAPEFESRAFARPVHGGSPAPTLDGLLHFHELARGAGDDAGMEWARRQLESFRPRVAEPDDQRRIDLACDRPERVNPRLVGTYIEAMQGKPAEELETFVSNAYDDRDANAGMAAFLMAREAPEGPRLRWVRMVLSGLGQLPDSALSALRAIEAESRADDAQAARAHAEFASGQAEAMARLADVEPPSNADLARLARIEARPPAQLGEPIGLALDRRGLTEDELADLLRPEAE